MADVTLESLSAQLEEMGKQVKDGQQLIAGLQAELEEQKKLTANLEAQLSSSSSSLDVKDEEAEKPVIPTETFEVSGKEYKFLTPFVVVGQHPKLPKALQEIVGQKLTATDALANSALLKHLVAIGSGKIKEVV